ncbi:MAG: hypothetical protein CL959_05400 [Euryarchaeota archaeon]|nr:hypothetical protein [Euryarchaeota archaeon]
MDLGSYWSCSSSSIHRRCFHPISWRR